MMNKIYKKLLLLAIVTIWWLWIFGDVSTAFAATSIDPTINQTLPLSAPLVTCSTWADMSNVLLAGVCFKSESGSSTTTLLVKEGKVAINSDDIDRTAATAVLLVNWVARGTSILNYSDIKLKTNIQKIDSALEKVTKLNGYRFTWKDSGQPDFGVLAQEVEKVFADAVSTDDTGMEVVVWQ